VARGGGALRDGADPLRGAAVDGADRDGEVDDAPVLLRVGGGLDRLPDERRDPLGGALPESGVRTVGAGARSGGDADRDGQALPVDNDPDGGGGWLRRIDVPGAGVDRSPGDLTRGPGCTGAVRLAAFPGVEMRSAKPPASGALLERTGSGDTSGVPGRSLGIARDADGVGGARREPADDRDPESGGAGETGDGPAVADRLAPRGTARELMPEPRTERIGAASSRRFGRGG
jgi:hypothetical protein